MATGVEGGTTGVGNYERTRYFRMKEAELLCREQELATETKMLELTKAKLELLNMREEHRLNVE
ncbi:regulatory protein zeste-like [Drosophila albomicans]|uniref:Regulatory protein zeste-like n=1 Tax=Drosophila albomicans TaxID=7291 RepID=A0A9C6TA36_DROAB|nr:regulatory protein zeste-like [Drosophila albomicans]